MPDYIQLEFKQVSPEQSELLIAELSAIGFDGFEEAEGWLKAFVTEPAFNEPAAIEIATQNSAPFISSIIKETNWNAVWESNFDVVTVDNFAGIRAAFHESLKDVEHEIVITPKMSFGTGHHATTYMMIEQMQQLDFNGKHVFDFGTGTGVLAILAEKCGASAILAVDNDDWSISNARENFDTNFCTKTILKKAANAQVEDNFDIVLANINKNIILDNLSSLSSILNKSGVLLLSGLLETDENEIAAAAEEQKLQPLGKFFRNKWMCMKFTH